MTPLRRLLRVVPALLAATACAPPASMPVGADQSGTIAAEVVDAETGAAVVGADLWAPGSFGESRDTLPTLTRVRPGRWTLHVEAPGYAPSAARVRVARGDTGRVRVALRRIPSVPAPPGVMVVRGRVVNVDTGRPVFHAHIGLMSPRERLAVTAVDGTYRLDIAVDTLGDRSQLRLVAAGLGLTPHARTVPVRPGEELVVDFRLEQAWLAGVPARPRRAPARVAGARIGDAGSHARGTDR